MLEIENNNNDWESALTELILDNDRLGKIKTKLGYLAAMRNVKKFTVAIFEDGNNVGASLTDIYENVFELIYGNDLNELYWNIDSRINYVYESDLPDFHPLTKTAELFKKMTVK